MPQKIEPYEQYARWSIVISLLLWLALTIMSPPNWWVFGLVFAALFPLAAYVFPLFLDKVKKDSPKVTIEGLGTFSCRTITMAAPTADDKETGMPGMCLVPFGGGNSHWVSMDDGGTPMNRGGYWLGPIDALHHIADDHVYISALAHPATLEAVAGYSTHFLAYIQGHGWNEKTSEFYISEVSTQADKAPSIKVANQTGIAIVNADILTQTKAKAQEAMGDMMAQAETFSQFFGWKREQEEKKRFKMKQKEEEQESQ